MHREVIAELDTIINDEKEEVQNQAQKTFDLTNLIVILKHDEQSSHVENHQKIFIENCEPRRSEEKQFLDAEEEGNPQLNDQTKIVDHCETILVAKPDDIQKSYENEDSKNTDDDEETAVLLNGIPKIFLTRETAFQNEKRKTSSEHVSIKDEKNKQEKNPRRKSKKNRALATADALFSVVVVAPIVVTYWNGLWTLMDLHHEIFPAHGYLFLGIGIHTSFAILKYHFHAKFASELETESIITRLGYRLVRMSYTYLFSAGCIMNWRGAWIIFDECTAAYEWFLRYVTVASVVILILLRSARNLIAPPYVVAIDKSSYVFQFPTRFNMNTRDWSLYILDCAFSVGVVGTLVVFVWRGVWVLFDLYLYPENAEYSAVGSIVIGYSIVVITFCLQPLMRYACTRLKGLPRLAAIDVFLLLSFVGTVNVWRGVWNVLGLWLFPEDPELSCWITHLGCFIFLVLLNCSNSILVRGVYIDAEEAEGKCAVFPCHYLRLFFKIEREKKEARRQNLIVASRDLATITERTEKEENGALMNTSNSPNGTENPESLV